MFSGFTYLFCRLYTFESKMEAALFADYWGVKVRPSTDVDTEWTVML